MSYAAWKLLHLVFVVAFLGNITTGVFWAAEAHRTRDFRIIGWTFASITRSDRWFTIPGVLGLTLGGVAAAMKSGMPILGTGWIAWSLGLFALSGVVFGVFLAPLQRRITAIAGAGNNSGAAFAEYESLYRRWAFWGFVALATPVAAMVMMVLKPSLPAP